MRLFLALDLPESLKAVLADLQARSRAAGVAAAWPDPAGLHLTLAFLGEQPEAALPAIRAAADAAAVGRPPFRLSTAGLGAFPETGRPRVAWLGLAPSPELAALAEALRRNLAEAGIPFDPKPFRPHLTLARFRGPGDLGGLGEGPPPQAIEVAGVTLFQSLWGAAGARYVPLARLPLTGSRPTGW